MIYTLIPHHVLKEFEEFNIAYRGHTPIPHHVLKESEEFNIAYRGPYKVHTFENKTLDITLLGERNSFPSIFIHAYSSSYCKCINDCMYMGLKIDT